MVLQETYPERCCHTAGRLTPLEEVLQAIDTWPRPALETEEIDLGSAITRVIAEPVIAAAPVPPHRNSAVDGYGYRSADWPPAGGRFRLVGRSAAGHPWSGPAPEAGAAIRILTGAAVPAWVDTVAMQEHCTNGDGAVTIPDAPRPGSHIRAAGEDVTTGAVVLQPGNRLRPQEIGVAASVGRERLSVFRRLRVAVFATGDELRNPGSPLPEGCIHDSNRFVEVAFFRRLGFDVTDLGIIPDRYEAVRLSLDDAARSHDLVIASGGVSEGDEDHVVPAIRSLGSLSSWKLAVRPGKPLALGTIGPATFVGLPGNPVAAFVALAMVARPLALRLAGATNITPQAFSVAAAHPIRRDSRRRQFLRGRLDSALGALAVQQYRSDGSGIMSSLTWSDGLIDVSAGQDVIPAGHLVEFIPHSELFA
jgi:molybdopterin molybdotransferase